MKLKKEIKQQLIVTRYVDDSFNVELENVFSSADLRVMLRRAGVALRRQRALAISSLHENLAS